jgi:hypothetical protein
MLILSKTLKFVVFTFIASLAVFPGIARAIDIGAMTWTPRVEWVNVQNQTALTGGPNAKGDGTTDDTAAIQAALTFVQNSSQKWIKQSGAWYRTVYFPAGTYKISSTLTLTNTTGIQLIGCGKNSIIKWYGPSGGAMLWANGTYLMRYLGLEWNGNNLANCAYEELAANGAYTSEIRHENESFKNFTKVSTYSFTDYTGTVRTPNVPAAGIIGSYQYAGLVGEMMIFNCAFASSTTGLINAYYETNNYMWNIDGCEFESCGTGINLYSGFDYIIQNCHFSKSTVADITGGGGIRVHHCTSSGSAAFLTNAQNASIMQDCWVDGWTSVNGAVQMTGGGPFTFYDNKFTHPPTSSLPPIETAQGGGFNLQIVLSNNYAPNFPTGAGMVHTLYGSPFTVDIVPGGARKGIVTAPTQTFLSTATTADSTHIIDVTQSPYTADQSGTNDSTATIQAAINAAKAAKNNSIVYIPAGYYRISSTLAVSGSKYTIQGAGYDTQMAWFGGSNGTVFNVTTPTTLNIQKLRIACLNWQTGDQYLESTPPPVSDATTITGINQTSTGASSIIYDDIYYNAFVDGNPFPGQDNSTGPGVVLTNLGPSNTIYMPHVEAPLNVVNCGAAQILGNFYGIGMIHVSGTGAKTGFLGFDDVEGGQQENSAYYNINVTDNQDLVIGDYYTEQSWNDVSIQRGAGTVTGHVAIEGLGSESGNNNGTGAATISLNVNNYAGRVYYGSQEFADFAGNDPVSITHTGTNAVNLILQGDWFDDGMPIISTGSGASLIEAMNQYQPAGSGIVEMTDNPNPLTAASTAAIAQSLDDLRQLGELDTFVNYGIEEALLNNGFEADAANPNPTTALGYNPASWTVNNAIAAGGGVRNATVVSGGSPFGAGTQSINWVDTTGSTAGSGLQMTQSFTPTAVGSTAIETFDFCYNTNATTSDVWFFTGVGTTIGPGIHISSNGSTVYLGANINGGDTYCATLTAGVWYRARVVMGAPNGGKSNATLYVTPWNGTGPGTTTSYTIDGVPATQTTGYNALYMNSAAYPVGASQNVNFDNIGIVTKATLVLP